MSVSLETIRSLCKRRGFVFPSSEIYQRVCRHLPHITMGTRPAFGMEVVSQLYGRSLDALQLACQFIQQASSYHQVILRHIDGTEVE